MSSSARSPTTRFDASRVACIFSTCTSSRAIISAAFLLRRNCLCRCGMRINNRLFGTGARGVGMWQIPHHTVKCSYVLHTAKAKPDTHPESGPVVRSRNRTTSFVTETLHVLKKNGRGMLPKWLRTYKPQLATQHITNSQQPRCLKHTHHYLPVHVSLTLTIKCYWLIGIGRALTNQT